MRKLLYSIFLIIAVTVSFMAGSRISRRDDLQPDAQPVGSSQSLIDEEENSDAAEAAPGVFKISPYRQQLIGMKVDVVRKEPVTHTLRILGRVEADDTRSYRVNASTDGWILRTFPNTIGSLVKKGEVLATFSTPQFAETVQNYFSAVDTAQRLEINKRQLVHRKEEVATGTENPYILQRQADLLRGLGMHDQQIEEIGRNRKISPDIRILSPATGFVTARKVSPGERFEKNAELFRIVDLSRVWILADVFENEAAFFKPGATVLARMPRRPKTFETTISRALPIFDAVTRTFKVRLEADNPEFELRPDMFVDLEHPVKLPPAITVPVDAVVHSGLRKTVFVERDRGLFEPRRVETGWCMGDRIEILDGLVPGERIVVAGNFFVNSESRLQAAAQGIYGEVSMDPVCATAVDEARARSLGRFSEHAGRIYYFDSADCKSVFDKDPAPFVSGAGTPRDGGRND